MPMRHWLKLRRYSIVEPFGFPHSELRHGTLVAAVHRASTNTFKNAKVFQAESWMRKLIEPMSVDQIESMVGSIPKLPGNTRKRGYTL